MRCTAAAALLFGVLGLGTTACITIPVHRLGLIGKSDADLKVQGTRVESDQCQGMIGHQPGELYGPVINGAVDKSPDANLLTQVELQPEMTFPTKFCFHISGVPAKVNNHGEVTNAPGSR